MTHPYIAIFQDDKCICSGTALREDRYIVVHLYESNDRTVPRTFVIDPTYTPPQPDGGINAFEGFEFTPQAQAVVVSIATIQRDVEFIMSANDARVMADALKFAAGSGEKRIDTNKVDVSGSVAAIVNETFTDADLVALEDSVGVYISEHAGRGTPLHQLVELQIKLNLVMREKGIIE